MDTEAATVGAHVRAARIRAGYKRREDVTPLLRVPRFGAKVLGQVERGERPLYEHEAEDLARVFDVDVATLTPATPEDGASEGDLGGHVETLRAEIRRNRVDIEKQNGLLAQQSKLLDEQTELLKELRQAVSALPVLREALELIRGAEREGQPALPVLLAPGEVPAGEEEDSRDTG